MSTVFYPAFHVGALDEVGYRLRTLSAGSLRRLGFREETYLVLPAAIVGVIAAAAAAGFHELILLLRDTLYRPFLYDGGRWLWLLVLLPALGGLGVGLLVKLFRAPAGHGVVDVMASVAQSRGFQRPRTAIEKILTSGLTIGSGGSAGAEGPIVQIGAALSTLVGRLAGVTRTQMPILVGCGAAAGISAIFNAPIGGVLFTLEVILLDFSLRTFTPVVVAAVIANVTTKAIYDGLARPEAEAVSHYGAIFGEVRLDATIDVLLDWPQLGNYLLLGVVCGVLAMGFTRAMLGGERVFGRLAWLGVFRPAVGGLGVGVLGVTLLMLAGGKFFPVDVYPMPAFFGDGYGAIQTLLGDMFYDDASFGATLTILGALLGAKLLATCLTLCSGGSGGVIAPSLFLGATAGGIVGLLLRSTELFRDIRPELYALVGMGATLAAVVHAPLASILILTELTGDYRVVLPAMLACVTATGFARLLFADSIYTHLLHKRGIRRGVGRDLSRLRRMAVEQVGLEPASVVSIGESMTDVVELMTRLDTSHFVVLDEKGMYAGVLLGEDLNTALLERDALPLLTAEELMRRDIQPLLHTDDLGTAFERFVFQDTDRLPVAHADTPGKVIGVLTRAGLMREYQRDDG